MGFTHNCGLSLLKLHPNSCSFWSICLFGPNHYLGLKHWGEKSCAPTDWDFWHLASEPGWHRLAVVQARLRRGRVDTGGSTMLVVGTCQGRGWSKVPKPFWVFWNHMKPSTASTGSLWFGFCSTFKGTFKELWWRNFVAVGPLCCVQSMLWISKLK